jgi:hypothetical protein
MRNVAFSILMFALAVVQIAIVSAELSSSRVQVATTGHRESDARYALASTETKRKAPAY